MNFNCAVINIGNEILLGKTVNSNLAWLGNELAGLGFEIIESLTIQDDITAITSALSCYWERYDIVITTGGLGPTEDDITKNAIATAFGKKLLFEPEIWEQIKARYSRRGIAIPQSNRSQAMVPRDFEVMENQLGTAPGLHYQQDNKHFFALQGVPLEMKHIFDRHMRSILQEAYPEARGLIQRTLHSHGISESALAEIIFERDLPQGVNLAWLPQSGRVDLKLMASDPALLAEAQAQVMAKIGDHIWGRDAESPASKLLELLSKDHLSLAVAESCTAGLLQAYLADVPGASEMLLGGVVSYANSIKEKLLNVDTIPQYGAVSAETALAMADGVQKLCESDVAIAVTGIAGPSGGSAPKPVGTVHFAFKIREQSRQIGMLIRGDRTSIRHKAAEAGMLLLIRLLQGKEI